MSREIPKDERNYTLDGNFSDDVFAVYMYEGGGMWEEPCGYGDVDRYFSSIRTMDESIVGVFDELRKSGQLNNTVIFGAGDHGEVPGLIERMSDVNAPIVHPTLDAYPTPLAAGSSIHKGNPQGQERDYSGQRDAFAGEFGSLCLHLGCGSHLA